jgi:hypothetical protein
MVLIPRRVYADLRQPLPLNEYTNFWLPRVDLIPGLVSVEHTLRSTQFQKTNLRLLWAVLIPPRVSIELSLPFPLF